MSITYNVTTNAGAVAANIGAGKSELMARLPYIFRAFMVLTIRELLNKSYPILGNDPRGNGGNTNSAKDTGDENIEKEINRAFTTWDSTKVGDLIMAKNDTVLWTLNNPIQWRNPRLKRAWEKQDIDTLYDAFKAAGWSENPSLSSFVQEPTEDLHNAMRDPQSGGIKSEILKNPQMRISVRDREALEAFIIQRKLSVGKMAGGWVKALAALGHTVNTPFGNNGSGSAKVSSDGMKLTANNKLGDFNSMVSRHGVIEDVLREQSVDMRNTLQQTVDGILNKYATAAGTPQASAGGGTPSGGSTP